VKIVIAALAKADIDDLRRYIAKDNPAAAKREVARIKAAMKLLSTSVIDGREVCLEDGLSVHIWLVSSYRVYYTRTQNELHVLRVYHQARRPIAQ